MNVAGEGVAGNIRAVAEARVKSSKLHGIVLFSSILTPENLTRYFRDIGIFRDNH
jgi:hypothetical protein